MPRVAIVFTGGTISMQPDPDVGGNRPILEGAQILARAPEAARLADLEPIDWGLVPASHLRFADLLDIARLLAGVLSRTDIDGALVVQGTDTIEESAFAWDLLLETDKPVVVTGAMRDAAAPDYDGPRNLADAVRCAIAPELGGAGVVVVMDGLIVAGDDVIKRDTSALGTFQPRDGEPLGRILGAEISVERQRGARRRLGRPVAQAPEDVHLVTAAIGADGTLVRGLSAPRPAGLVVAATGSGNTHPDLLAAAVELIERGTAVCLTTRCPTGSVAPTYAFPGGGAMWQRAGALLSTLDGPKTRVALALGLGAGLERSALAELLERPAP